MRKMKKINGYLVVRFNDREKRQNADTGLGSYGVIDAELYSGVLDVDRSAMEYDSADTLEEAIEQARGLESEMDVEEPEVKVTIITETDTGTTEQTDIDPVDLFERESKLIKHQAENPGFPYINECTAAYHMRGYLSALQDLGLAGLDSEHFPIDLDDLDGRVPVLLTPYQIEALQSIPTNPAADSTYPSITSSNQTFRHPPKQHSLEPEQVFKLGLMLMDDCPDDDCIIYRNTFRSWREMDEQLDRLTGEPRQEMEARMNRQYSCMERMYRTNYAVRRYRQEHAIELSAR